jgi:hypothetical protein
MSIIKFCETLPNIPERWTGFPVQESGFSKVDCIRF